MDNKINYRASHGDIRDLQKQVDELYAAKPTVGLWSPLRARVTYVVLAEAALIALLLGCILGLIVSLRRKARAITTHTVNIQGLSTNKPVSQFSNIIL